MKVSRREPVNTPVQEPERKKQRRRRIAVLGVVTLINGGLLIFLLTQLLTPASQSNSDPLLGHAAPGFSLKMLNASAGQPVLSLANFKGKPVVLNFWASWCEPCKEETPLLERTWKQMQAQGKDVVFLGVDYQDASSEAHAFLQRYNVSYPAVLDTDGSVATRYGIASLPQTLFHPD